MATWTGPRDVDRVLTTVLGAVPAPRSIVYISQPITTGRPYLRLREALGQTSPSPAVETRIRAEAMAENRRQTRELVARVRTVFEHERPVVDPSDYEDEVLDQEDFHGLWSEIIRLYTAVVVLADGWQYSTGCSIEFAAALEVGLPLLDDGLRPMPYGLAVSILSEGLAELQRTGLGSTVMTRALTAARSNV